MKNILITGIGGDIAQTVATLVREARPGARIVGSDVHGQHAGRLFADECAILPPASDPGYANALKALVASRQIDLAIPVTEAELAVMAQALGDPPAVRWVSPGPRVVAAVIDYEPRSIDRTRRALINAGYRIEVARSDGISGIEAFESIRPALVLVEAMIPKKNGFEVCQELKKTPRGRQTPIIIMTSVYKGRRYRTQAIHNHRCDEYLEKPIPDEQLIGCVAKFLGDPGAEVVQGPIMPRDEDDRVPTFSETNAVPPERTPSSGAPDYSARQSAPMIDTVTAERVATSAPRVEGSRPSWEAPGTTDAADTGRRS